MSPRYKMVSRVSHILVLFVLLACSDGSEKKKIITFDFAELSKIALEESLISIRPGNPAKIPFWNNYSKRFISAPSFNFPIIDKAIEYKFLISSSDNKEYEFKSQQPWDNLSPIWGKLSVGYHNLEVIGVGKKGNDIRQAGTRRFYKAAVYNGPYNVRKSQYDSSAFLALSYLFNQKYIQNWGIDGKPDTAAYKLYHYPSKIIGAVIECMILYSQNNDMNKLMAKKIAQGAADYLISISEPQGAPLEYFPATYKGDTGTAGKYRDQFMMIYPAEVAQIYLNLYDFTRDNKYFEAAIKIADTYAKLQLASGTWKLKLWKDGRPVKENLCIPVGIIEFLHRLNTDYDISNYQEVYNKAFNWILENPVKTFDWSGQFEDINPSIPYKNLTKIDACSFAIFLFENFGNNSEYVDLAEEILQFSEDQFIVWEKPMPHIYKRAQEWITPCVLEQYDYYVPIDASASKLINTYLAGYTRTNKKIYLAKAVELANAMTIAQMEDTGRYPTYWEWNDRRTDDEGWLNCAVADIKTMIKMENIFN